MRMDFDELKRMAVRIANPGDQTAARRAFDRREESHLLLLKNAAELLQVVDVDRDMDAGRLDLAGASR